MIIRANPCTSKCLKLSRAPPVCKHPPQIPPPPHRPSIKPPSSSPRSLSSSSSFSFSRCPSVKDYGRNYRLGSGRGFPAELPRALSSSSPFSFSRCPSVQDYGGLLLPMPLRARLWRFDRWSMRRRGDLWGVFAHRGGAAELMSIAYRGSNSLRILWCDSKYQAKPGPWSNSEEHQKRKRVSAY